MLGHITSDAGQNNRIAMFNCEKSAEEIKEATGAVDVFCLDAKK